MFSTSYFTLFSPSHLYLADNIPRKLLTAERLCLKLHLLSVYTARPTRVTVLLQDEQNIMRGRSLHSK